MCKDTHTQTGHHMTSLGRARGAGDKGGELRLEGQALARQRVSPEPEAERLSLFPEAVGATEGC